MLKRVVSTTSATRSSVSRRMDTSWLEALYSGVENQTAITYGNHFGERIPGQWPKTGIGTWFDFIIVHESAHEWFGNSITARDRSDMWIHEGWANYCESLFVEFMWGKQDGLTYMNTGKEGVKNAVPILTEEGIFGTPPVDQYKKGALFLNTIRSVVNDDAVWFKLLHDYYQHFKYQTIMTTDIAAFFNQQTGLNLTPMFNQYLRHAAIPTLELRFDDAAHTVAYGSLAGRRAGLRHAHSRRKARRLADGAADHEGVEGARHFDRQRRLRSGDRPLLRECAQGLAHRYIEPVSLLDSKGKLHLRFPGTLWQHEIRGFFAYPPQPAELGRGPRLRLRMSTPGKSAVWFA